MCAMSKPRFKFSSLRSLLSDLGFNEVPVKKPYIGFEHGESDTWIILPPYRSNALVAAHHLAQVRIMLDAKGIKDADEFDRIVANSPARHSASS
jgi:hypothetical protein